MRFIHGVLFTALVAACGGSSARPASPAPSQVDTHAVPSAEASAPQTSRPTTATTNAEWDDPEEVAVGSTVTMTPVVARNAKIAYPKRNVGDRECWQGATLAGEAKKDFTALIDRCGTPTGLVEYAKPVTGKLHHVHDKRDTYKLKLLGGMCYRYFAVADSSIKDLDILVTKPNGALIADDKTSNPVAIIEFDKSWCMDQDAEYDFHIEVDGEGTGHYVFGVWAKPKGK
jgi:hypothetical protein